MTKKIKFFLTQHILRKKTFLPTHFLTKKILTTKKFCFSKKGLSRSLLTKIQMFYVKNTLLREL